MKTLLTMLAGAMLLGTASAREPDLDNGEEINEICAGCHGEYGQGDLSGKYPRLAGLPDEFIAAQLRLFRDRKRPNIAMIEHVDHRQMPDPDIQDISAYLARIELPNKLPPVDENDPNYNAYERLLLSKRLVQIPQADGDMQAGETLYRKECRTCHGAAGEGSHKKAVPMLAGQHTDYLWRQIDKYLQGDRIHDPDAPDQDILADFSSDQLRDIFAYLSILDD